MPTTLAARLAAAVPRLIEETVTVAEIPAPTFREQRRAEYVRARLAAIGGWDHLAVDSLSNVVAVRRGAASHARVLMCAHLDTVFPDAATPVTRSRGRLTGRGVGDNSAGVASMLQLAEAVQGASARETRGLGDLIFAANVGEEGLGDLRGVRRILRDYAHDFDAFVAIEAHALNRIQTVGVASLRYEVSVTTDGGHSWGAYGRPNAIALLARAIVALEPLMPPVGITPKTTMNAGVIRGGRSVNTIAPDASFELDIRSADPARLAALARAARAAMRRAVGSEATLTVRQIGSRPGGSTDPASPLIRAILGARRASGLPAPELNAGSTDANAAIAAGYPATCIGLTTGAEGHTEREWINTAPMRTGLPYIGRAITAVARLPRSAVPREPRG